MFFFFFFLLTGACIKLKMKCENWAVLGYVEVASLEPARLLDKMVIKGKKQGRNCHLDQILTGALWDYVGDF